MYNEEPFEQNYPEADVQRSRKVIGKASLSCLVGATVLFGSAMAADRYQVGSGGVGGQSDGPCSVVGTINTSPTTVMGDSCNGTAVISDYSNGTCNSVLYPGPEVVYQVDVGSGSTGLTMVLTPAAADLGIFMVGTCGDGSSCIAFNDAIGGGIASDISQSNPAGADQIPPGLAAASYYVYVDSYYAAGALSCGPFDLDISGTLPVELIEFSIN